MSNVSKAPQPWKPYFHYEQGNIASRAQWVDNSDNPYYKSYFGGYVCTMRLHPTHESSSIEKIKAHYCVSDPLPFSLDGDFTIIINPDKKDILGNDNAVIQDVVINIQFGYGPEIGLKQNSDHTEHTRWYDGLKVLGYDENSTAGDSISTTVTRIVYDADDIEQASVNVSADQWGMLNNNNTEPLQVGTSTLSSGKHSSGAFRTNKARLSAGVAQVTGQNGVHATTNFFQIVIIPHKTRGKSYIS